jgi:acetyl esterase/lipase
VKEAVHHWRNDSDPTEATHHKVPLFSNPHVPLVDNRPVDIPDQLRTSAPRDNGHHAPNKKTDDLHPISAFGDPDHHPGPDGEITPNPSRANPAALFAELATRNPNGEKTGKPTTLAQCDTPLILDVKGEQVVVDTQIQLYATNAQLCHPWVSPVLGYLGGLPPLYICAGDNEVLRDEIVYM